MRSKKRWQLRKQNTRCTECKTTGEFTIHRSHYEARGKYKCENCGAEGVEIIGGSVWDDQLPAKGLHGSIERVES
jgi:Zn finger protein HypA/HybF involved in hydrogenase expression